MSILPQLIINSIIAGALYALVALGFNLIYGATKFFNMAHGVLCAVGGYAAFFLISFWGWNIYLAVIIAVIFSGAIGWGLDKTIYYPLRRRKASSMVLLVASLGAFTAIQAVIAILFTSQFQTLSNYINTTTYTIAGAAITQVQVVMLVLGLVIFAALTLTLKYSLFGKAITAISDDEEVAKIVGINTDKIIGRVFFVGSAIAGLAGIMTAFDTGIEPTMGLNLLLKGVIAAVIGGVGSIYGAILGAFLLGFVENFGIWQISGEWKDAIAFGLLIIFLLFRPRGIIEK